jgi:hypothetical protein
MDERSSKTVRHAIVEVLRRCADHLATLPDSELDALLNGELELKISVGSRRGKSKKGPRMALDQGRMADIASRLRSLDSRVDGERLLSELASSKSDLEALARHLDVAVRREDRAADVFGKIIETTIGFRLSTAAIQGRGQIKGREAVEKDARHEKE